MTAPSKTGRELEIKLAIPEGTMDMILHRVAMPAVPIQPPHQRHEVTTYFDTPDLGLARRGLSLRVRCTEGRKVQTLKADRQSNVAADRAEWEWCIDHDRPS